MAGAIYIYILLRKFFFCSERMKNRLFTSYCCICVLCGPTIGSRPYHINVFPTITLSEF